MEKSLEVGDKVSVLLPYWVQVQDDVEPFVQATVVRVSEKNVTVEYDAPNTRAGKASLVVEDLDRIAKI
jgi:hypothetical protein